MLMRFLSLTWFFSRRRTTDDGRRMMEDGRRIYAGPVIAWLVQAT